MKFSVVIPTYKRQGDLNKCLSSLLVQSLLPSEILIIDDDTLSQDFIKDYKHKSKLKSINLVYYQKDHKTNPRGTSESRNIGLSMAKNEIVFILDDDLILLKDYFKNTITVLDKSNNKYLVGVGGVIANNRNKGALEKIYNKIFLLSSEYSWDVTEYGFQVWNDHITELVRAYYVHGGVCAYKKSIALGCLRGFTQLCDGRVALEDVDFCMRAKCAGYYFMVDPSAAVEHYNSAGGRDGEFNAGLIEGKNRKLIGRGSLFLWSYTGWAIRQFIGGNFMRGFGIFSALLYR